MGLLSLGKRRLHGDLIAAFQCLKGAYREAGEGLFFRNCSERTRNNGYIIPEDEGEGKFSLDTRRKFFIVWVVRHWNRLPREIMDAPTLAMVTARLDGALSNLV